MFELSRYLQLKSVEMDGVPLEFIQNEAIEGSELVAAEATTGGSRVSAAPARWEHSCTLSSLTRDSCFPTPVADSST